MGDCFANQQCNVSMEKIAIKKNNSIKSMVANIYVQDCVEHKTRLT